MKLHFEDDLDYQLAAVRSVVDLFAGQEISRSEFSFALAGADGQGVLGRKENELGIGNDLRLADEQLLENLKKVQLQGGLALAEQLKSRDFTIEMETGTGKTYVYLRTVFELYKNYGFSKFMIVVPSVAIKEGVNKTLEITRGHFEGLYPEAKGYEFFQYDSGKLGRIRNFAISDTVQIMVATVGAINKKSVNNLYKEHEALGGESPLALIQATNPILIIDEPQSVDGGLQGKGKEALEQMRPLCTLRYSATHSEKYNRIYRLTPIDAYELGLVKTIEVASLDIQDAFNAPYVRFVEAKNIRGSVIAKVELDIQHKKQVRREIITVEDGDDLSLVTSRDVYRDIRIGAICRIKGQEYLRLTGRIDVTLRLGEDYGGINKDERARLMLRRTIKEHLDKELRFKESNLRVKVLSLFFIDKVEYYRGKNAEINAREGKYAKIFAEEYKKLANDPAYHTLFSRIDYDADISELHNGYFSQDKKGGWQDTAENNAVNRENAERAYNLIMKDKEKLLSFESPLKFIFSHSALREGWDNPNVFQICSLRDMGSERERRQTLGRGLRLCVNQEGQRLRDRSVNTLTVIASESYEEFAEKLQKEIEEETGIHFGIVEEGQFAAIPIKGENGEPASLGMTVSREVYAFLRARDFIDNNGKVQDRLRTALKNNALILPDSVAAYKDAVTDILKKLAGKLDIKNANERCNVSLNKERFLSEDFKQLWERIKYKTHYRVDFNNEKLIEKAVAELRDSPHIVSARARFRTAKLDIDEGGIAAQRRSESEFSKLHEENMPLPDILSQLQDKTQLTRHTLVRILCESRRLGDFKRNPQQFIDTAAESLNRAKRSCLVDGIKYQKLGDQSYYAQELFEIKELSAYLNSMLPARKSIYESVIYDSAGVEKSFAEDLEANEAVKLYVKLPDWFKISTPLGSYNPDWAILIEKGGQERFYFVVETKDSLFSSGLRGNEVGKIQCGEKHFSAIAAADNPAKFKHARTLDDVIKATE